MIAGLRVSVTFSGFTRLFDGDLRRVLDAARAADDSGIDQLVLADHVVMGSATEHYPFGTFPYGPEEPWPEPLTLLAAMAGVTERVRLATGVLIAPLRPAALLAKTAATLDVVSDGRLDLGVGVGWQREEYDAVGVPFEARWSRLDDQLRACRALWTQPPPVTFTSATVSFGPTWCEPRPVDAAGVPLWFGMAATPATVARITELGIGWLPIHTTTSDELRAGVAALRAAFEAAGRDPAALGVRAAARPVWRDDGRLDGSATRAEAVEIGRDGVTIASFGLGRHLEAATDVHRFLGDLGAAFAG